MKVCISSSLLHAEHHHQIKAEGKHGLESVQEALAGLLPAAGCAPQLSVLDAVNFPTLLGLAPNPPEDQTHSGQSAPGGHRVDNTTQKHRPAGGAVLLQPLLSHADRPDPERCSLETTQRSKVRQK